MRLKNALKIIEEREKIQRKEEKEMQQRRMPFGNKFVNNQNSKQTLAQVPADQKNLVHVQSVFPKNDVIALKIKTRESHVKQAILKAVYFYLENADEE